MATASWAHISAYWISVAAIAGVFCPKTLVATSCASWLRLAAISAGGTCAANAASYAPAAAVAWVAASAAWAAVPCIQARYGVTAAAMLTDDGPTHEPLVRLSITDV